MIRKFVLWVGLFLLVASGAQAASYEMRNGTVVDPILTTSGEVHSYSGPNLEPGVATSNADLRYATLINANLANANLTDANLAGADLTDADLYQVTLYRAYLGSADLTNANLFNPMMRFADLNGATLVDATLSFADLMYALLIEANLRNADLTRSNFYEVNLNNADLSYADLTEARWLGATFGSPLYNAETDFTGATADGRFGALFDPVAAGWTFVPEPNGMLLGIAALSCVGLLARRRTH